MLLALAVGAAISAPALLTDPELEAALGPIDPAPGAWVEYLVRSGEQGEARVRVTALAAAAGGKCWLELAAAHGTGIAGAVRVLVHTGAPAGVERMYVMLAGQQPLEIPLDRVVRAPPARPQMAVKRLGAAKVTVPAGSFDVEALRVSGSRVWRTAGVPLWGLVKARSRRQTVELLDFGFSGGRSVFPAGWNQGNGSESTK